jgi:hypothetical protein
LKLDERGVDMQIVGTCCYAGPQMVTAHQVSDPTVKAGPDELAWLPEAKHANPNKAIDLER